jgi:hypothetical protein
MVSDPDDFEGGLGVHDRIRRWEVLTTLAATAFMGPGGTVQPLVFIAIDPVNHYSSEAGWTVSYFFTNNFIIGVFQNYFFVPGYGGEVDETWGIGGLLKRNDETGLRLTWQF